MRDEIQREWANAHVDQVMAAAEADDYEGFCVGCGEQQSGVEPDARNHYCDVCARPLVFGAEELMLYIEM